MTPAVEFRQVSKTFGATRAADGLSVTIERGEFFSLLGPSGCGKTTTLRLLFALLDSLDDTTLAMRDGWF